MNDPLTPVYAPPLSLISTTKVTNVFPTVEVPYRLAIIGEAPGADEEAYGLPFIGASGRFLDGVLSSVGILRSGCFVGNVCKYRPPGNDITEFGYTHEKVLAGWEELKEELHAFQPNCILALGNTPLHFLCNKTGITSWRGSILSTSFGKVVPSIHPAAVLREYKDWPLLRFDAMRARTESESTTLSLPQRNLELDLSAYEICHRLDNWPTGRLLSFDIEGGLDAFPCCSVASELGTGFIIAWSRHQLECQGAIARSLSRVLYRFDVPKVLQNSLYDRFVLAYGYNMLIRNVVEDTMDKSWAIYPELPKSLGTIASIWTREPAYKFERKTDDPDTFYRYCIKDSCITLEACLAMQQALTPQEERHYRFNVSLKSPLLYMELRGFAYDQETANSEKTQIQVQLDECANRLALRIKPIQWNKKEFSSDIRGKGGSISDRRLPMVLYSQKGYPPQYKGRGLGKKITCDIGALLTLAKKFPTDPLLADIMLHRKLESVRETLNWKVDPKDGRIKCAYNQFSKGEDNQEEGGGATDTGRLRCSQSLIEVLGKPVGGNLQTVTKKLRKLYRADPENWVFQCDLAGADGWTVAARCLQHGDPTMWDDYMYGLKPALIIVLMYLGTANNSTSRADLLRLSKAYKQWEQDNESQSWLYFACKRIQHASNYGVQATTGCAQIMKDSYKLTGTPVYLDNKTFEALQRLYYVRYSGIYSWHNWAKQQVASGANLTGASGHERKFFGRRKSWNPRTKQMEADHETWKEFLADEPQENTTYATNLALHRLWNDPDNRCEQQSGALQNRGRTLHIEPLHQVHDALIGQFAKDRTTWAIAKIREYFNNELEIANTKVTIPFEGSYGPSWGELGPRYGGGDI